MAQIRLVGIHVIDLAFGRIGKIGLPDALGSVAVS